MLYILIANDFAHESSGFLTWHRLFLLWFEREMQIALNDRTFTVRYWDWTVESNRNSLFTDDKLGGNNNGDVTGKYYGSQNWKTICWKIEKGKTCNPSDESARYTLRRCPSKEDCNNMMNWPTRESVIKALSYDTFAEGPYYNKYSTQTFSNALEGFDPETEKTCDSDAYTKCDDGTHIARELHNLVLL